MGHAGTKTARSPARRSTWRAPCATRSPPWDWTSSRPPAWPVNIPPSFSAWGTNLGVSRRATARIWYWSTTTSGFSGRGSRETLPFRRGRPRPGDGLIRGAQGIEQAVIRMVRAPLVQRRIEPADGAGIELRTPGDAHRISEQPHRERGRALRIGFSQRDVPCFEGRAVQTGQIHWILAL